LEQITDEALLLRRAEELGFNADLEIVQTMDRLRRDRNLSTTDALEKVIAAQGSTVEQFKQKIRVQYLSTRVLQSEVFARMPSPSDDEIRAYYNAHLKDFDRPAGMHLREIAILTDQEPEKITSQRNKAEQALAALKKGDDFAEVARKYSESPTAQAGGDLGFLRSGEVAPLLDEVTARLESGQVSDIVSVEGALMIIKVDEKHQGGILPFELARKEVRDILWRQATQPRIREYLTTLRAAQPK
jgi:parvulin-like peptidyl-prolyl isomerase